MYFCTLLVLFAVRRGVVVSNAFVPHRGSFERRSPSHRRSSTIEPDDAAASVMEPWMQEGDWHEQPPFFERAVLQQKLSALPLSEQKLRVLQDAAQRMVRRHEAALHETRTQHATQERATQEQHATALQRQQQTGEQRIRTAETQYQTELRRQQERLQQQWVEERKEYTAQIAALQDRQEQDRAAWVEREAQWRAAEQSYRQQVRQANATRQALQMELQEERERYRLLQQDYTTMQERYERWKGRWNQLRQEHDAALAHKQAQERQAAEQMEIATAAVAAATQREQDWQEKYEALQQQLQSSTATPSRRSGELSRADDTVAVLPQPRRVIEAVWNARAVRVVRRWMRFLLLPQAPASLRRRPASKDT